MESEQIRACVPDALVSALYGHLMEDRPWDGVLRQLMAHTDSAVAGLRICLKGARQHEMLVECWAEDAATDRAEAQGGLAPLQAVLAMRQPVAWDRPLPPACKGAANRSAMPSLAMLIDAHEEVEYVLELARPSGAVPFGEADVELLRIMGGHFYNALRLRRAVAQAEVVNSFHAETLDRLGIGAILVDCRDSFKPLNATARTMLEAGEGLHIAHGRLRARDPGNDRQFQAMVKEALAVRENSPFRAMPIRTGESERDINLLVGGRRKAGEVSGHQQSCALVFLKRSSSSAVVDIKVLQELFSFTRTEARLVSGLVNGKSLEEIEVELNIRHNTARSHLRSIYDKAEVAGQSGLVQVLANSLAPLAQSPTRQ